eukprot:32445-Eustigmatos_ZCMA.PRE.1
MALKGGRFPVCQLHTFAGTLRSESHHPELCTADEVVRTTPGHGAKRLQHLNLHADCGPQPLGLKSISVRTVVERTPGILDSIRGIDHHAA